MSGVGEAEEIPHDGSSEDLDGLGVGPSGADGLSQTEFERAKRPFDHGPPSIAPPIPPTVVPRLVDHPSPRGVSPGQTEDSVLEGDDRPSSSVGNRLRDRSGLVALVEGHVAQREGRVKLTEQGRERRGFVDIPGGDRRGHEEGPSGPGRHERVELHEPMAATRVRVPQLDPALVAVLADARGIAGQVRHAPSQPVGGGLTEERLEVSQRDLLGKLRDGRGSRELTESQSVGELREGLQHRTGGVVGPSGEGPKEKEPRDIAGVGRWPTACVGRSDGIGRRMLRHQLTEEFQRSPQSVPKEVAVPPPVPSARTMLSRARVFWSERGWSLGEVCGRKAAPAGWLHTDLCGASPPSQSRFERKRRSGWVRSRLEGFLSHARSLDKIITRVVETDPHLAAAGGSGDPVQVFSSRIKGRWPRRVDEGRARALMSRKVDLAGPGTSLIAAYSASNPMIAGDYWLIRAPDSKQWVERAMVLWLNSSFFVAQLFSFRTETRGTWGRIDKHRMLSSRIPDFSSFTVDQIEKLERLFDSLKDVEFPSVMDQLQDFSEGRLAIDNFFLDILNPVPTGANRTSFLSRLYAALLDRLNQLQKGM